MMVNPKHLEPAIWLILWIMESALTQSVQPTLAMAFLVTAILTAAAASLLALQRRLSAPRANSKVAAAWLICGGLVSGVAAALLIRGLYIALFPNVRPFGLAFNIITDVGWVSLHAVVVGYCVRHKSP